ncbi:MAG TPA: hypothetical protein VJI52_06075 [Candidatus Nanoarchaeia archaeon]|nr:hypothetical protein [Candidatus Nanoarchaeia archaeon]
MVTEISSLDLLVHPGYSISRVISQFMVDENSARNIERIRELWLDSISSVAADKSRFLALVNGTHLTVDQLALGDNLNPYRGIYRDLVAQARQTFGDKFFYFTPSVKPGDIRTIDISANLRQARKDDVVMFYNPDTLGIVAYGEHTHPNGGGCVDLNARDLAVALGISSERVRIDGRKSLPLQPIVFVSEPSPQFYIPESLYLTVADIAKLSQSGIADTPKTL